MESEGLFFMQMPSHLPLHHYQPPASLRTDVGGTSSSAVDLEADELAEGGEAAAAKRMQQAMAAYEAHHQLEAIGPHERTQGRRDERNRREIAIKASREQGAHCTAPASERTLHHHSSLLPLLCSAVYESVTVMNALSLSLSSLCCAALSIACTNSRLFCCVASSIINHQTPGIGIDGWAHRADKPHATGDCATPGSYLKQPAVPSGKLGKLRIHKSGKVTMLIGEVVCVAITHVRYIPSLSDSRLLNACAELPALSFASLRAPSIYESTAVENGVHTQVRSQPRHTGWFPAAICQLHRPATAARRDRRTPPHPLTLPTRESIHTIQLPTLFSARSFCLEA